MGDARHRPLRKREARAVRRGEGAVLVDEAQARGLIDLLAAGTANRLHQFRNVAIALAECCRQADALAEREQAITAARPAHHAGGLRSEEHTSELQSLMRISSAVFCLN